MKSEGAMKPGLGTIIRRFLIMTLVSFVFGAAFIVIEAVRGSHFSWQNFQRALVLLSFYVVCMVITCWITFNLLFRNYRKPAVSAQVVARALLAFLISAVFGTWAGGHLFMLLYPETNVLTVGQFLLVSFYTLCVGLPVFLYFFVKELWQNALERVKEKEVAQERLEKELLAARLKALQTQTNPHFLFNTLNSIASLISIDPTKAETTVEKLAGLFRYALDSDGSSTVRLKEELQVVEDYLAIEKVRFGSRMEYSLDTDHQLLDCRVPPLILQPLVENAVKHGVSQREESCRVTIRIRQRDGRVSFVVENDGPPPTRDEQQEGVGLSNLQSRCRTLYGEAFAFKLGQPSPGLTRAELEIPFKGENENSQKSVKS
jgi:two-component sensor histidine kinase